MPDVLPCSRPGESRKPVCEKNYPDGKRCDGLSPVQVHSLLFAGQTREDMATFGHFARAIGASHVTTVKIVNGLVVKELLDKLQHPGDRRNTIIRLQRQTSIKWRHWNV
ncbi:hypothetical protein D3C87_985980 [compost metagenome]